MVRMYLCHTMSLVLDQNQHVKSALSNILQSRFSQSAGDKPLLQLFHK